MAIYKYEKRTIGSLWSFVSAVETRYLYVQRDMWSKYVERAAKRYSDELNRIIQDMNMRSKYILIPYYQVLPRRAEEELNFFGNACGYLRCKIKAKDAGKSYYVPYDETDGLIYNHIIDLLLCSEYKMITVSNKYCFKALGDRITLKRILTDFLLDDAMCNSYFGTNELTDEKLYYFNNCKKQFIRDNKLISRYRIDEEDLGKIRTLSFASYCRKDDDINLRKYLNLWDSFIEKYYEGQIPLIPSVEEQLKLHKQYDQLPDRLADRIKAKPEGAYLVLRINKEPKEYNKEIIEAIFGMDSSIGKIKIVSVSEFYKEDYQMLIRSLAISAYKVVNKKQ